MPAWSALDLQPLHVSALISALVFVLTVLAGQTLRAREAVRRRATTVGSFQNADNGEHARSPAHWQRSR